VARRSLTSWARRSARNFFKLLGYEVNFRRLSRGEEGDVWQVQAALLQRRARMIVDAGAHAGSVSRRYSTIFPDAIVYCFEPAPEPFERLQQTAKEVTALRPIQAAVSDRSGTAAFHVNRGSYQGSLLQTSPNAARYMDARVMETVAEIQVPTIALDEFCAENGIDHIDVLKMDVQGGELRVLAGLDRMLGRQAVDLVMSEVSFVPQYEGQPSFSDLTNALGRHGYVLVGLYDMAHAPSGILTSCDALFASGRLIGN
jgi:FkbM family methyltransferase